MPNYTISYDSGVNGFPSFYSYNPDYMIGMNNFFYTFSGGNMYRHNVNDIRNQYYGVLYPSTLTSVFNDLPLENKLFKTIELGGDHSWSATLISDQQDTGYIDVDWFEKKEGTFFAFVRNSQNLLLDNELPLRNVNGIATSSNITTVGTDSTIDFAITIDIGGIISVGDVVYFGTVAPTLFGVVTAINVALPGGVNNIVVDNTTGTVPVGTTEFIFYVKNSVAESHGILGHYGQFHLENNDTEKVELFAVQSQVMKSFP
jgi:hypothetical protein